MVHALLESWRTLEPGGTLVDLRPYHANPAIEVLVGEQIFVPGHVDDAGGKPDDTAADEAIAEVVRREYFKEQKQIIFNFANYWETLDGLLAYAAETWRDFACIPPHVEQAARLCIAAAGPHYRIRINRPLKMTIYSKNEAVVPPEWRRGAKQLNISA